MKQQLASTVHFHSSFQMSINHVTMKGLVYPNKEVKISRLESKVGDPQEFIMISVCQVLSKHKINHLPL
jgi:hypothetical protein